MNLSLVQEHIVELLARLDRPPRNLRVRAGEVLVDITWEDRTWDDQPGGSGRAAAGSPEGSGEPVATAEVPPEPGNRVAGDHLTSPGVGVFYHASEPGAEPFVSVGSLVRPGQQVGIIEAMKLMVPVEADRAGRIVEVLKGNGEPVEYAEPLFALTGEEG